MAAPVRFVAAGWSGREGDLAELDRRQEVRRVPDERYDIVGSALRMRSASVAPGRFTVHDRLCP
jgi:hypothetical protein